VEAFEFLDGICVLEHSGQDLSLDHSAIGDLIFSLDSGIQKDMLQGIVGRRQSGHWARALNSVHGGWFALYKKLCRKMDPGRFLEVCKKGVSRDWKLAIPVIDDLIAQPRACKMVLELWKGAHRRRKSLWKTLESAELISGLGEGRELRMKPPLLI
jgi:hypothetical protein